MIVSPKNLLAAENALREMEVLEPEDQTLSKRVRMGNLLAKQGLDLPNIAENLTYLSRFAEKEETKLKANELALKIHDVLTDDSGRASPVVNIQINGDVNLGFLRP